MTNLDNDKAEQVGIVLAKLLNLKTNAKGWYDTKVGDYTEKGLARIINRVINDSAFRESIFKR